MNKTFQFECTIANAGSSFFLGNLLVGSGQRPIQRKFDTLDEAKAAAQKFADTAKAHPETDPSADVTIAWGEMDNLQVIGRFSFTRSM